MALYNHKSISDVVSHLYIIDRERKPFVAPNTLTQRPKTLGGNGAKAVYQHMAAQ